MAERTGLQHLGFWQLRLPEEARFVYAIQAPPDEPIKIGCARDVHARITSLQTGNPRRLALLYVLATRSQREAEAVERDLHRRAGRGQMVGEWFSGQNANLTLALIEGLADRMVEGFKSSGRLPRYRDLLPFNADKVPWSEQDLSPDRNAADVETYKPDPDDWPTVSELWMDGASEREIATVLSVSVARLHLIFGDMRAAGYALDPGARRLRDPGYGHVATPYGHSPI